GRNRLRQGSYLRDLHAQTRLESLPAATAKASLSAQLRTGKRVNTRPCLGGAKPILPRGRGASRSLLNQQAFRLEKQFELDHSFHRAPLVLGGLETLQ